MRKLALIMLVYLLINLSAKSQSFIHQDLKKLMTREILLNFESLSSKELKKLELNKEQINGLKIVLPIYWVCYPYKSNSTSPDTIINMKIDKFFFDKLKLINVKIKNRNTRFSNFVFEGIIYNNTQKALVYYSENKIFYCPSVYQKNLLKAVLEYDIIEVFYINNVFNNIFPYFLINRKGEIYVYTNEYKKDKPIGYQVVQLDDFIFNNSVIIY